jgi:hypothetical protein
MENLNEEDYFRIRSSVWHDIKFNIWEIWGACGSIVGWGTMLQAWRSQLRVPMRFFFFFNLNNPSSCTMALGSTQPLTEMSTRKIPGGINHGWHVSLTTLLPSVSWFSRCGSLDLSHPYGTSLPVTGIAFFLIWEICYKNLN